jgi:hypothetical protein
LIFSQTITPKIQLIGKDTCFCFTIPQSKIIAKELQKGLYNDSILTQTECELGALKEQKATDDKATIVLQQKVKNQSQMLTNQENAVAAVTSDLQSSRKNERNQRWQKRFFVLTTFLSVGFTILK